MNGGGGGHGGGGGGHSSNGHSSKGPSNSPAPSPNHSNDGGLNWGTLYVLAHGRIFNKTAGRVEKSLKIRTRTKRVAGREGKSLTEWSGEAPPAEATGETNAD